MMAFWTKEQFCPKCDKLILKGHRIKVVHHRFLFFRWETMEHRCCEYPDLGVAPRFHGLQVEQRQMNEHLAETMFQVKPIPGREFSDCFGPSEEQLARDVYELGKEN